VFYHETYFQFFNTETNSSMAISSSLTGFGTGRLLPLSWNQIMLEREAFWGYWSHSYRYNQWIEDFRREFQDVVSISNNKYFAIVHFFVKRERYDTYEMDTYEDRDNYKT